MHNRVVSNDAPNKESLSDQAEQQGERLNREKDLIERDEALPKKFTNPRQVICQGNVAERKQEINEAGQGENPKEQ